MCSRDLCRLGCRDVDQPFADHRPGNGPDCTGVNLKMLGREKLFTQMCMSSLSSKSESKKSDTLTVTNQYMLASPDFYKFKTCVVLDSLFGENFASPHRQK